MYAIHQYPAPGAADGGPYPSETANRDTVAAEFQILTAYPREHDVPVWVGEFPGFDPYPFGARRYVTQLVLSTCFAEPLSDEFAACFAAASDEELVALGECFAFRNCAPDEALGAVVESRQVRSG